MTRSETGGVVLVIGPGGRAYREYLFAAAARCRPLWLLTDREPAYEVDYVRGFTKMDLWDHDAVVVAAGDLAARMPVDAVVTWVDSWVVSAARVAEKLDLPGAGVAAAQACKDKNRNRELLSAAGLRQPGYARAGSAEEAVAVADRLGYPVVVKPRGMGASMGVSMAADAGEVRAAFEVAERFGAQGAATYRDDQLIEQYLVGPEIAIDGALVDGNYTPMYLARKRLAMYPYFEEAGHIVDPDDPLLHDEEFLAVLRRAHEAIDFRWGITHTEVKLTAQGPVIVEINARLGGDLIPRLGELATGIDPASVAISLALGQTPKLNHTEHRIVGVRFGYPAENCVAESLDLPSPGGGLLQVGALTAAGAELRLPPAGFLGRHSYVICTAGSPEECDRSLDKAAAAVRLTGRSLAL